MPAKGLNIRNPVLRGQISDDLPLPAVIFRDEPVFVAAVMSLEGASRLAPSA